jgi:phosphatidylserine/phosphatidylglycerophosphate/cardiolipin synthase-like enzyme
LKILFYKLFLKTTTILFLTIFCTAEIKAVLPEQDQTRLKTSPKQILSDSEDDPEFLAAVTAIEEEYLRAHPKPEVQHPSKKQKVSEDDLELLAVVTAAEEEYLRTHPRPEEPHSSKSSEDDPEFLAAVSAIEAEYLSQKALSSSATDRQSQNSQLASPALASHIKTPEASQIEDLFDGFSYKQLSTPEDHQQHLINAIHRAKRSILITSYKFSADMREGSDLFEAVQAACYRGVKLYFYANTIQLGESEINSLSRLRNLLLDAATVHSKLLIIDNKQITCGSYDWLAEPWNGISQNASLILKGGELEPVVDRIWDVLKKYRNVDFNPYSFGKVEENLRLLPSLTFQFNNPDDSFEILNTPYEHGEVFEDCFQLAQHQLTLCTPFITGDTRFLREILPPKGLINFLRSGKKLNIFYRSGDEKVDFLNMHLEKTLSRRNLRLRKNVTLTPVDGLHRKSLFIDEDQYIEGSYNWLSSARSLDDPHYYMETSLRFTGTWAKELISEFYDSIS